jgi:fatty acid desaturase
MFMHLPCWSLPKAHRLLKVKGRVLEMEVRRGYLEVIRMAASGRSKPDGDVKPATGGEGTGFAAPFG